MYTNSQVCSLCSLEILVKGFICHVTIKLIGNDSLARLISEPDVYHNLIGLDLPLGMLWNPSLIKSYLKELPRLHKLTGFLRKTSGNIREFKILLRDSKKRLISHIKEVFSSIDGVRKELDQEINTKLKCLSNYKSNLFEEGKVLMEEYRAKGRKVLSETLSRLYRFLFIKYVNL
jgi:hypothetical protein